MNKAYVLTIDHVVHYQENKSIPKLAKICGRSEKTIRLALIRQGVYAPRPISFEFTNEMKHDYLINGFSVRELGEKYKRSPSSLRDKIHLLGINRSASEAQFTRMQREANGK